MIYDLIVLGGGPGGYLACERAAHEGLKTLLIEKEHIGGVCLNEGCVPTKTLLYSAKLYDGAVFGDKYGVEAKEISIDHKKVVKRKDKVVSTLTGGISHSLKSLKVEVVMGQGKILGKENGNFVIKANEEKYLGKNLIVATGSSSITPPIEGVVEGLKSGFVLTNKEILNIMEVPKELTIIGGGVIGLEMASYFNSVGSKVTVVEMMDKIGGMIDFEIGKILKKNYEKKGVTFQLGAKVVKVRDSEVFFEKGGKIESVKASKVLMCIGRSPNTKDIGLESVNAHMERGRLIADEKMKTNVPSMFSVGDVNGKSMLAHTAYREAEVAVNNILGKKDKMKYSAIPSVIYTNPEIASVGETEETAKEKGYDVIVKSLTMKYSGRYIAENEGGDGIIKIVVDKKWNKLIGVHLISNYASELIIGAGVMIEKELTIDEIKKIVFPHPSVCEMIREVIFTI